MEGKLHGGGRDGNPAIGRIAARAELRTARPRQLGEAGAAGATVPGCSPPSGADGKLWHASGRQTRPQRSRWIGPRLRAPLAAACAVALAGPRHAERRRSPSARQRWRLRPAERSPRRRIRLACGERATRAERESRTTPSTHRSASTPSPRTATRCAASIRASSLILLMPLRRSACLTAVSTEIRLDTLSSQLARGLERGGDGLRGTRYATSYDRRCAAHAARPIRATPTDAPRVHGRRDVGAIYPDRAPLSAARGAGPGFLQPRLAARHCADCAQMLRVHRSRVDGRRPSACEAWRVALLPFWLRSRRRRGGRPATQRAASGFLQRCRIASVGSTRARQARARGARRSASVLRCASSPPHR